MDKLTLIRRIFLPDRTIGTLYLNDTYLCDTLEDTDRKMEQYINDKEAGKAAKVWGDTCIPRGRYTICKHWWSKHNDYYPLLLGVPFFTGILIHTGNTPKDSTGCILLGTQDSATNTIINSRLAMRLFRERVKDFDNAEITII